MVSIYLLYFFFFAIGLVFGSFLNLVSDRVISGEPIFVSRSVCDFCKKKLGVKNLIPLFSYLYQRGRSACCKRNLSFYYPLSEVITGAAFVFSAKLVFAPGGTIIAPSLSVSNLIALIYLLTIFSFFIILFLTDAKYHLLPDKIVYSAIFTAIFFIVFMYFVDLKIYREQLLADDFGKYLIEAGFWHARVVSVFKQLLLMLSSALFIAVFFMMLIMVTKGRGMGGGDVKLGFLIGVFNGFPQNIVAIFLGFLFGAVYSVVLIALKKKKLKDVIAFGPFLIAGSFVAFVWGDAILKWYFGLF